MIAHVQTIRPTPGGLAQTIEMLRERALPHFQQADGFVGMLVLASLSDSASGERVEAVTLWDDRQALDAATSQDPSASSMPQLLTAPTEAVYDVAQAAGMIGGNVCRFISAGVQVDHIETVVSLFENVVMHAATEQGGFRRGLLLVDRANGNVISIGLWHSEADLQASERVGYLGQQIGNFTHIVTSPIVPETLVVAVEV